MLRKLPNGQKPVNAKFAYLALALPHGRAHFCHMDKIRPNRINELRTERDLTIEDLAEATGLSVSYLSRLENGTRNLSVRNMNLIAHALEVEPKDLLPVGATRIQNVVAVMGRVGAGAEILPETEQVPPEGLYEIETPFPIPEDAIAFEVSGESMWPRYDPGDIVVCWRQGITPTEVVGHEAAVKTSDGSRYLKRILKGAEPGTFDLESHNAQPIRSVRLTWVAPIQSVIRSGQWNRLPPSSRHNLVRKMTRSY